MIVCHCHGITDRQIRRELGPGGTRQCPAGSSCGGCAPAIAEILQQIRGDAAPARADELQPPSEPAALRSRERD